MIAYELVTEYDAVTAYELVMEYDDVIAKEAVVALDEDTAQLDVPNREPVTPLPLK